MQPDVLSNNFGLLNLGSRRLRNARRSNRSEDALGLAVHVDVDGAEADRAGGGLARAASTKSRRRPLVHVADDSNNNNNMAIAPPAGLRRATSLRNGNGTHRRTASSIATNDHDADYHERENGHHRNNTIRHASGSSVSAAGTKRKRPSLTSVKKTRSSSNGSDDVVPLRSRNSRSRSTSNGTAAIAPTMLRRSSSSRSSLSLRQGLTNLVLSERSAAAASHSPEEDVAVSPTRSKSSRHDRLHSRGSTTTTRSASSSSQQQRDFLAEESSDEDDDDDDQDSDSDDNGAEQDDRLLLTASFWQLERLRKQRLERLAAKAGLPADGLKKTQILDLIIQHRSEATSTRAGPPSSNTRSSSGAKSTKSRSSVGSTNNRLSQPPSDHSADYTDDDSDDDDGDDEGDSGSDSEVRSNNTAAAPAAVTRTRRGVHHAIRRPASPMKPSPIKKFYERRIAGRRPRAAAEDDAAAASADQPAIYAPSPMVNRLRKQKSLLFAASSPIRTRTRRGGNTMAPAGTSASSSTTTTTTSSASPMKPRLRPRRRALTAPKRKAIDRGNTTDDQMDEDWIDSVSLSQQSNDDLSAGGPRVVVPADAEMRDAVSDDDEDEDDGSDTFQQSSASDDDDDDDGDETRRDVDLAAVAAVRRRRGQVQTHIDGSASEREDGSASGSDSDSDSDRTSRGEESATEDSSSPRAASPTSPAKVRRLRNGKLRILPEVQVEDTDGEVDAVLSAESPATPKPRHRRSSSSAAAKAAVRTVKPHAGAAVTKPKTPPLSSDNAEAQPADSETVDELNGLDLESLNLTDKEIPPRQLEKSTRIGSGGFKDVYVGIWKVGKRRNKVAIADIREKLTEMDIKELGLLRDLKHENIVRFIGVSIPEDTARTGIPCMIVSELCSNGDLWDYVRGTKPPADLQIFRMLLETARGLEYLHMHSIVHRDVKSSNVLVTRTRSCKINDFGLARVKRSQRSKMKSVVGTVNWQAVELWCKAPQYNEKVDVWSAAMTFWEALQWHEEYKSYPFEGMNDFEIYEDVGKNGMRPPTDRIQHLFGEEIVKLLNRMWDADPRKRPTMDMVCKDLERLIELKEIEMEG